MLTNLKQYNGEFGCDYCKHSGKLVRKENKDGTIGGEKRVFPLEIPLPKNRTHEETLKEAREAVRLSTAINGVKGPSVLHLIPGFNIILGMIPDYMHCVLLGVVYQFLTMWLNSPRKDYYIKNPSKIDSLLNSVKPPSNIRRAFRSIEKYLHVWKASELRTFLLFYSPVVLKLVLAPVFYNHWLLLVNAFRLLLQKSLSATDINTAKLLIYKFIGEIPELYGEEHVNYNVHLLIHVVESVENWGAPWASSAFLYEDAGGKLKNSFHGTRYVAKQMLCNFLAHRKLREFSCHFIPFSADDVQDFYAKLDSPVSSIQSQTIGVAEQKIRLISKPIVNRPLNVTERLAIERLFGKELNCKSAVRFNRIAIDGKVYCTTSYCENLKRDNSLVSLKESTGLYVIEDFVISFPECNCLISNSPATSICEIRTSSIINNFATFQQNPVNLSVIACDFLCVPVRAVNYAYSGLNLTHFMKRIDPSVHHYPVVSFFPKCIANKCILIKVSEDEQIIIENNVRFELD